MLSQGHLEYYQSLKEATNALHCLNLITTTATASYTFNYMYSDVKGENTRYW